MITEGQWKRWKDNSTTDDRLNTYVLSDIRQMLGEIERLNQWADGFSDAQLKERRLCEARIAEMQSHIDKLSLALMMIREGVREPAKFAGDRLAAVQSFIAARPVSPHNSTEPK